MTTLTDKKIVVTGGAGFLGRHVIDKLKIRGVKEENISVPRSKDLDLKKWENCEAVAEGADIIIHLAAKVGGIGFNQKHPGESFYDNILAGVQLMEAARIAKVEKFVAMGSVCAYPKFAKIPFKEEDLWAGYPEETNAPYGLAKKMMLVQAQAYRQQYGLDAIYLLAVNLYGPGDNFDPESSHVIPALIRKVKEAKDSGKDHIDVWGTGNASREFLYVEDAAEGIVLATERYDKPDPVNLGAGMEIRIRELVEKIAEIMQFNGEIRWDSSKPDGQPRRCLDVSRAYKEFGFKANTSFDEGLRKTIKWYERQKG